MNNGVKFLVFCIILKISLISSKCCPHNTGKNVLGCCATGKCNIFCCNCDGQCRSMKTGYINAKGVWVPVPGCNFKRSLLDSSDYKTSDIESHKLFQLLDLDKNGKLDLNETLLALSHFKFDQAQFAELDKSQNGFIEPNEFDSDLAL